MNDIRIARYGALVLAVLGAAAAGHGGETLYVSTVGNDHWSGRLAEPDAQRTDGPLATLTAARDRLRALRAEQARPVPLTVRVRGGDYVLAEPLVLQPVDGGTADAPVVYEAADGETPVLSGGTVIAGLQPRGHLWEVEIPEVKAGRWYFRQLFVNGQRRTRARAPNTGYYRIAQRVPAPPDKLGQPFARDRFEFAGNDLQRWERLADVNVVLMHSWETSLHPLRSVDPATHIVEFTAPLKEWWCIGYWEPAQRYYVENARELLDEPGEWYLNRETGVLSYWPLPGETPETTVVVAPHLTELVRMAGDPDRGAFVDYITLRGLTFHHNDWVLAPTGNSSTQAAVEVPAAVMADGARQCRVTSCEVAHVGTYGIWLRRGCQACTIERTRLFDLGAGGIRVGEANRAERDEAESRGNIVDNNHIYDGGRVYAAGIGVWVAQSSYNRISNNDIHDLHYSGISIGWNWDDAPNRTHHNVIERNHVHHLGHGVLSDAGLIYCLGASPGSVIRNNLFHDMWPYSSPPLGWGIYLDATCSQYLVENNLVYNTLSGGLMYNNGGHEHVIQNNIFALSTDHALWPAFPPQANTFRRNIVYLTQGELFIPLAQRSFEERVAAGQPLGQWDRNLYWHADGAEHLRFLQRDWADWQALGLDRDSLIADPQFADVASRNFQLAAESPAQAIGFHPINLQEVGLYGDAEWVREASHTQCPVTPLPPPPAPFSVRDDFEDVAEGAAPPHAHVNGERQGASIAVSGERAAGGRQSLKITDVAELRPGWEPHFFYQPRLRTGVVRQTFDVWMEPQAQFFTQWRDSMAYPANIGPSVEFAADGNISANGRALAAMPAGQWVRILIEAAVGRNAPRTFRLMVTTADGAVQVFPDLPFGGEAFRELHWLGFVSTAETNTAFFLDNLRIQLVPAAADSQATAVDEAGVPLTDIRVRDPFVLADAETGTYYLYAQMDNRLDKQDDVRGVEVYTSRDLESWSGPEPVFVVPAGFWADWMVWAPEVHRYRDKYYLFVTFTSRELLAPLEGRPPQHQRGTQVLVADSPRGPFEPFANHAHTPADWMALDGTLWVEDGVPWMVFCHEWVQTTDGTMELVQLTDDLSGTVGAPRTLFRATDAPWVRAVGTPGSPGFGYVTDGPFLHRTPSGRLIMIWSSFGEQQYAVGCAVSTTGSIAGPWEQCEQPLFAADGGHGMIFRTFDGRLMLALHQPNSDSRERARFFQLQDDGDGLELKR